MTLAEFSSLLCGLGADTPLARVAQIRLENDKNVLKIFTYLQHKIRNDWRSHKAKQRTQADIDNVLSDFENIFAKMLNLHINSFNFLKNLDFYV